MVSYNEIAMDKTLEKYLNEVSDDNPEHIFSSTSTNLLVKAVNGKIDLRKLAEKELYNRGLDKKGKFRGFVKSGFGFTTKKG